MFVDVGTGVWVAVGWVVAVRVAVRVFVGTRVLVAVGGGVWLRVGVGVGGEAMFCTTWRQCFWTPSCGLVQCPPGTCAVNCPRPPSGW